MQIASRLAEFLGDRTRRYEDAVDVALHVGLYVERGLSSVTGISTSWMTQGGLCGVGVGDRNFGGVGDSILTTSNERRQRHLYL
jgi:hypothetical protein